MKSNFFVEINMQEKKQTKTSSSLITEVQIHTFQQKLLEWYSQNGRDLPWRHTTHPYHILVAEMMLHQTQVKRVLPKYREWLKKYPTFRALATASLEDVRRLWYPLGYNFRSVRLHQIAQIVVNKYNARLPSTLNELINLHGIGRYTAGAILSFAFHKDAPIVDTNVRRVFQRIFGIQGNLMREPANGQIWRLAETSIPCGKAYVFNQALMDFGALVCTARSPVCTSCFMKEMCWWKKKKETIQVL